MLSLRKIRLMHSKRMVRHTPIRQTIELKLRTHFARSILYHHRVQTIGYNVLSVAFFIFTHFSLETLSLYVTLFVCHPSVSVFCSSDLPLRSQKPLSVHLRPRYVESNFSVSFLQLPEIFIDLLDTYSRIFVFSTHLFLTSTFLIPYPLHSEPISAPDTVKHNT